MAKATTSMRASVRRESGGGIVSVAHTPAFEGRAQVVSSEDGTDTLAPNSREVDLDYDVDLDQGDHYVYFRLIQADGNPAWISPFFVTIES